MQRSSAVEPDNSGSVPSDYSCVLCGAGPAGMGFLFYAFKNGKLAEVARNGLLIIDRRMRFGAGKLGDYVNVTGNSVAKSFLACLEHERFDEVFGDLREYNELHKKMAADPYGAPLLSEVGELLTLAAERLIAHLVEHFDVDVLRGHEIDAIRHSQDGRFEIAYHDTRRPAARRTVISDTVVMNLGGTQRVEEVDDLCRTLDIPLPGNNVITCTSDELLRLTSTQLVDTFAPMFVPATAGHANRITIIGGSHSAFTMTERLATDLGGAGLDEIAIIHRSPIRLFFETEEEARAWGYTVDPVNDICPITRRVNRSSGLRYRAFEIACSVMSYGRVAGTTPRIELIDAASGEAERARAATSLAQSCGVVHSAGYGPSMSALVDHRGAEIPLQFRQGGIEVDKFGRPFDISGNVIRGLFTFGLGSGFRPDPEIGSEAAFTGRIHGVWIFHHEIGKRILTGVLKALAERVVTQEAEMVATADDDTPAGGRPRRGRADHRR
ncbi:hypothetical protein B0G81_5968 [Paraburkholderia sp. BL6665CI2N2]|uniref:hypothetical protein n=1 Tax=Paraburkholderia sp. BL6665CI2N2 TaxID=1938806 RepID=UPI0010664D14|nr:hypothetical protein [Paraburkholderia sp. BL6665CI2N2]TDY25495.1 hypothetical protein B0G81_5968 [Paraburkholderia sp. BL6665CI2N2]